MSAVEGQSEERLSEGGAFFLSEAPPETADPVGPMTEFGYFLSLKNWSKGKEIEARKQECRAEKLEALQAAIESNGVPPAIFDGIASDKIPPENP